ncbi:class I SAM-dependent methyltransferase [Candidatus Pacearchaeota archaeon]|nr:class I SAM-dependent methyltransferase [Candidatus Pacearchaeota archaeon]
MSKVWDDVYAKDTAFFGDEPSKFAIRCYDIMKKNDLKRVLEIGCGQGRDCLFFASKNLEVTALDYSQTAINNLLEKLQKNMHVNARVHDMKKPLPFDDSMFDAVYSHMFSMRFTTDELRFVFQEVKRVLKSNGFHFFSVRNHNDKFYGKGTKIDDEIYDINGFQIRFFTTQEIENLSEGFKILEMKEDYEEPVTLYLLTSRKNL